ncbi:hypothetical protein TEA_023466 [Camellia sinensis var. sinensis]|uniref:Nuclear envelope integral membrane protein 1 n=1 Tax=Camellia sinensis var. sinensis TaxID=542762 RepID=A0A4S4D1S2_CAMSN|nr:hypothetical protein TEA_023466 [Camellia sinensis var. sinensis]
MGITSVLWLFFIVGSISLSSSVVSANELSLDVAQPTTLQISPRLLVEKSLGSKHGAIVLRERVLIHGMCPQGQWEKLVEGSWVRSMSPFDHKLLDVRMVGSSLEILQVSLTEEFFSYRVIFLVLGIINMTLASSLSKSLVFYYSSAMAVGIILVISVILFQKFLPTSRKNSIAIFVYSSIVGWVGFFLLRYLPRLLRSVLTEMGISEDMYNPLAIFLLVFLVLAGAWLGFWVVHKLVLTEDGLIDIGVSKFVAWSIRIIASVMILQSSVDPLLAAEALLCGVVVRRITRSRFIRHLYKNLRRTIKHSHRYQIPGSSPSKDSYDEYVHNIWKPNNSGFLKPRSRHFTKVPSNSPIQGLIRTPPSQLSDSETHYSSFHMTPERRKFSKDEWEKFTKDSTKKALEELVSSPDFSKWAVINAERITLSPKKDTPDQPFKRIPWF